MKTLNSHPAAGGWLRLSAAFVVVGLALGLAVPRALSQANPRPPERMTYQGFLVDGNGVALGNTAPKNYDIVFRIWNHETSTATANLLWGEQQTVTVDKGYFSVLLGEGAAVAGIPNAGIALSSLFRGATASDRWVSITVKGLGGGGADVDIVPRLRLLSSPYAFLAHQSTKLVQDNGTDLIAASGNAVTVSGPVTASSFTGTGSGITGLNAGNISAGTLSADRLPNTAARRDQANTFTGDQTTSGHLRVGLLENSPVGSAGYGKAVVFSGAPRLGTTWNNDNSDPLWIARYNTAENQTQLRINLGDDPGSATDRLVIGTTSLGGADFNQAGTWTPLFQIDARGSLEFRPDLTKEVNAGKVGYELFTAGALDIVGAGTTSSNRRVKIWSEGRMQVSGGVDIEGGFRARGGYPGAYGVNNNGYAFSGNGGDDDSGMFSDQNGHVRFVSNNNLRMTVYPEGAYIHDGGLYVDSYNGRTFQVVANYFQVFHGDDKNKSFIMWRYDRGVAIRGYGGGWGNASGSERTITWDGDANWDVSSDRKMKKDIVDAEPMLERALQVQVRRFRWKDSPDDSKPSVGVIAQELEPLFPDLVSVQEDPITKETNLAVGYSDFGLIAVKALQELKARQDAELADLRAEMAAMKAQMAELLRANAQLLKQVEKASTTTAAVR